MVYVPERYVLILICGFKVLQNYQVGPPWDTHKVVRSLIQITFDGKIKIFIEFRIGIHRLALKRINFYGFYSSLRSQLFDCTI